MVRWFPLLFIMLLALPMSARGADKKNALQQMPKPDVRALLGGNSPDALAGSLRGYLVDNLPPVLFEDSKNWGHTTRVRKVHWKGSGLRVRPEVIEVEKNDGTWRKIRANADNLPNSLIVDLRNFQQPEAGPMTFDVFLAFDLKVHYDQQNWERGLRLYSGSARARMRIKVLTKCELTARLETNGGLIPEAVVRLRVTKANLSYDNLVVEHIAGVGGEMAQLLGDAIKGSIHEWHPSLERDLLAKANAAIVKAGDTKEVRISVGKLLKKK